MSDAETKRDTVEATGTGETSGEAKWAALQELERLAPGLDKEEVEYQVVSEGERGLLGVGVVEATVVARVTVAARKREVPQEISSPAPSPLADPETNEDLVSEVLLQISKGLGVDCKVSVVEKGSGYEAVLTGDDLGVVIGRHGQTIDAIQHLAQAALGRHVGHRVPVVVDAADYRVRRAETLAGIANQAADEAVESGMEIQLEVMSASERKIIHLHLSERDDVETLSEGTEPNRFVVVRTLEPMD